MSLQNYMEELCQEKGCSFRQLAIDMDITYSNMIDIKNGKVAYASDKLLNKLSAFLGVSKEEAMFRTIRQEMHKYHLTEGAARYLANLYVDKYMIEFNPAADTPFEVCEIGYMGAAYKKRSGNTLTLVDAWSHKKSVFWTQHQLYDLGLKHFEVDWKKLYRHQDVFVSSVLGFALNCVQQYEQVNKLQEYVLVFEEDEAEEMKIAEKFIPKKIGFKVKLWMNKRHSLQ